MFPTVAAVEFSPTAATPGFTTIVTTPYGYAQTVELREGFGHESEPATEVVWHQ